LSQHISTYNNGLSIKYIHNQNKDIAYLTYLNYIEHKINSWACFVFKDNNFF